MTLRLGLAVALLGALGVGGCHVPDADGPQDARPDYGAPLQFTFGTIDGEELSSDTTRGRSTVLLFVTTYDLPSQAEAQLLRDVLSTHKPLANGAIVMMEPPHTAPLARVWAESIGVKLPIAMASPALLSGESPLGRIAGVPTLMVLDRRGRLIARADGGTTRDVIEQALRSADSQ